MGEPNWTVSYETKPHLWLRLADYTLFQLSDILGIYNTNCRVVSLVALSSLFCFSLSFFCSSR